MHAGGAQHRASYLQARSSQQRNNVRKTSPSCRSYESRLSPWRWLPIQGNMGNGATLGDASRKGNDTHGCHRRRSDQGRTEFSSVALHISTPPSFRPAPKDASHRQHRSHLQSEPHITAEEARLKPPPSTHLEPQQPQAMQGPDPSRWPSPAPRDCHTGGSDPHHQPHFDANFIEASPPTPHT